MAGLKPSVEVPQFQRPGPAAPPMGKAPKTRAGLVIASHLFAAIACGAVLFADLGLSEGLKGGMVALIVREALGMAAKCYEFFLPQND